MMIYDMLSKHVGAVKVFSVNNFRVTYDLQLVYLLMYNNQWIAFPGLEIYWILLLYSFL